MRAATGLLTLFIRLTLHPTSSPSLATGDPAEPSSATPFSLGSRDGKLVGSVDNGACEYYFGVRSSVKGFAGMDPVEMVTAFSINMSPSFSANNGNSLA